MGAPFFSPELAAILALHPELNERFAKLVSANASTDQFYKVLDELAEKELDRLDARQIGLSGKKPPSRLRWYYGARNWLYDLLRRAASFRERSRINSSRPECSDSPMPENPA